MDLLYPVYPVLRDKDGKRRSIHSVLTFKTKQDWLGCINRDTNAVRNMRKLTTHFFEHGDRPLRYRRGHSLKDLLAGNLRADAAHTSPGGQGLELDIISSIILED